MASNNVESVAVGAHHGALMHIMKGIFGKEVMLVNIMVQMVIRMLVVIIVGMFVVVGMLMVVMIVVIVAVIMFIVDVHILVLASVIHNNVIMRVAIVWDEGATVVIADELHLVDINLVELCDDVLTFDVDHCLSLAHSSSC